MYVCWLTFIKGVHKNFFLGGGRYIFHISYVFFMLYAFSFVHETVYVLKIIIIEKGATFIFIISQFQMPSKAIALLWYLHTQRGENRGGV